MAAHPPFPPFLPYRHFIAKLTVRIHVGKQRLLLPRPRGPCPLSISTAAATEMSIGGRGAATVNGQVWAHPHHGNQQLPSIARTIMGGGVAVTLHSGMTSTGWAALPCPE